jgi:hypothetical protein
VEDFLWWWAAADPEAIRYMALTASEVEEAARWDVGGGAKSDTWHPHVRLHSLLA